MALVVAPLLLWALFAWLPSRLDPALSTRGEVVLAGGALLAFAALLYWCALAPMKRLLGEHRRQNAELIALHDAGLAVSSDLALESVLQSLVDRARDLIGTRYGALAVVDDEGRMTAFVTSGGDADLRQRVGAPPTGKGLLGVVLREGERLRLDDLTADPRAAGFPARHPRMRTLLAVPLPSRRGYRGNLYLTEKNDDSRFTAADEETLVRFAQQAAIAVDNAVLHRETHELAAARERLRLAGETYDGLAQVLAYVNTKSQVVREHCRQGRLEEACTHLDQLAAAARRIYAEQRARLLDLRALADRATSTVEAIGHHVRSWEEETGLDVELSLPATLEAAPEVELQLLRIVQEGLDNVRRHARARHVRLALRQNGNGLGLELADDGVGFDPALPLLHEGGPRFGLAAMRERAQAVGGTFEVVAAPGAGTTLRLRLPAPSRQEALHAPAHR